MAISIEHSHEEGTIVSGTARGDGTREIMRDFGLRWSRNLGAWFIPQSRDKDARTGGRGVELLKDALEGAGFTVELSIDNERRAVAEVQADRLERSAGRAERLEGKAERLSATATAEFEKSHAATAGIPFGQPILVGHHSQRRHERAIERSHAAADRGLEAHREAEGAARGAAAARATVAQADSPAYIGNRIEEAERGLRAAKRGGGYGFGSDVAAAEETLAYWRGELERVKAAGTKVFTKADLKVGDLVKTKGMWGKVAKLNAKTVAIDTGVMPWPLKYGYHEITEHKAKAAAAASERTE